MTDQLIGAHNAHDDLHSEHGARPGEHPGRSASPIIKVHDVLWLEFEKPDLVKAEAFAHSFGFATVLRTKDELHLRGSDAGAPCVLIRRGQREKFLGPAFVAAEQSDLLRLADATGTSVRPLPESLGGVAVDLVDPSGLPVRVVSGAHQLEALPTAQTPHVFNFGHEKVRTNAMQRPPRVPTNVQRLGHIVVQTPKYIEALNWYLDTFGMIVSDFSYYPGQRERGPILSFIRCDRGSVPADHHTLAMALGPVKRYMHSAYEVADLDALAAGGEYLRAQGYFRSWGIGRHIEGSQIFDYWRDPDGFLVEHYADGDMFDNTLEPGWAAMHASGLYQWGPPPSKDFLGLGSPREVASELAVMTDALRHDNEFDLSALRGLFAVANS
jgi:catechol 2,3-dioxygenase-like lactoylglutathione lyase family enzyme